MKYIVYNKYELFSQEKEKQSLLVNKLKNKQSNEYIYIYIYIQCLLRVLSKNDLESLDDAKEGDYLDGRVALESTGVLLKMLVPVCLMWAIWWERSNCTFNGLELLS